MIRGRNALDVDRIYLGTAGQKIEPVETDFRTIEGTIEAEFRDMTTFYDVYAADTGVDLDLQFNAGTIEGDEDFELNFLLADVRFTGDTPKVSDAGPAKVSIPFEATAEDGGAYLVVTYISTDTAI